MSETPAPPRACAYIRLDKPFDDISLENQEDATVLAACAAGYKVHLEDIYRDRSVGLDVDHVVLDQVCKAVREGRCQALAVYSLDRLIRSGVKCDALIDLGNQLQVPLLSATCYLNEHEVCIIHEVFKRCKAGQTLATILVDLGRRFVG